MTDDRIPTDGEHRGVGLHAGQSETRLAVVRRDIDAAHLLVDLAELVAFADDAAHAPEARLFAQAKALATLDEAVSRRDPRQRGAALSRERIRAATLACGSLKWQSPVYYCSLLDCNEHRAVRRAAASIDPGNSVAPIRPWASRRSTGNRCQQATAKPLRQRGGLGMRKMGGQSLRGAGGAA